MKIIIFLIVFVASMALIPDSLIGGFVNHNITISGDGEEAMNNFEFTVILIKGALSASIATIALWFYRKRRE
ncbi:hypothetical protein [Erwinia psidii]|uniref:Uncharacterized protein n=1 Tax=Erwinia psidii TaxID=69224 RepID=A0A3N6SL54_9GAMM|nr:hypothetical protein [Erwinia psidii]MCX8957791.1 hypothetical protein [Erwinia psidii]MCX8960840.1 hypothetical protein [Erwinia psidii]MCX8964920.1 hypothetical protein [Erwinia psidii]RQM38406.1 hypothetical protein EB241_09235 [Erwinia psidii]